jgi:hypothetical protein
MLGHQEESFSGSPTVLLAEGGREACGSSLYRLFPCQYEFFTLTYVACWICMMLLPNNGWTSACGDSKFERYGENIVNTPLFDRTLVV